MIKSIFFDLDWCILNSEDIYRVFDPVLDVIENTEVDEQVKEKYRKSLRGLTDIGHTDDLPRGTIEKVFEVYRNLKAPSNVSTYGDEDCINELSTTNFLITSGLKNFQNQKIDNLGIRDMFKEVYIDDIDSRDETGNSKKRQGKEAIFRAIIEKYNLLSKEILIVGDKGSSELTAGKNLGIKTVQTLRPKIERWSDADYHIESLCELKEIIQALK